MEKLKECKSSMDMVGKLATKDQNKTLMPAAKAMKKVYTPLYEKMYGKENVQGIYSSDEQISTKLRGIYSIVYSSDPMTPNQEIILRQTLEAIQGAVAEINGFLDGEWKAYREAVEKAGVSLFK